MELKPEITKTERLDALRPTDILRAADILRAGGTVAFPTETVYGLGGNALDPSSVAKIFTAKMRPSWDPLIVHISDRFMLNQITIRTHDDPADVLMSAFWPGPLTLLFPRTPAIPDAVTAGRPLVGVRMPSHPVALKLIAAAGVPIAAPSANTFGHTSPTTAAHVLADLDGRIDAILDGGPTDVGVESTVLDPNQQPMIVYRPGAITPEMIEVAIGGGKVKHFLMPAHCAEPESLPSPGVGLRHYAPRARLILIEPETVLPTHGAATEGIMLPDDWPYPRGATTFAWGPWERLDVLAQRLFAGLRALDDQGVDSIFCPLPPAFGLGVAIRERLQKAASPASRHLEEFAVSKIAY